MTPAATPEALAEALAEFQRRNGYHRPEIEELLVEFGELVLATATAEAAGLRAEVEAKDRALASLADNETLLLRAANLIDCGTAKHCEYFFHSKRVSGRHVPAQCARETEEGRGCLADDATSLRILSGKLREATALARAATAREG
ncbi:hypothetical protein HNR01_001722 [Methylorubrum rhodesianum]|uniref:hypothetical protein n=1 Tax=Methylorubrum rhodesianum TaxID=29427 RepID=UPI001622E9A5|nr:hypothetical protein [Methylorubrum rhodesianum]MBB5762102.1 hypothetical protein [Methylorubrum rhodesianum]